MYSQQAFQGRPEDGPRGPHFGGRPLGFNSCGRAGGRGFGGPWGRHFGGGRPVPVNIESTADSFVLTLFAAGLSKEKIQLSVQNDVLTIAYQGTSAEAGATGAAPDERRYTRREFRDPSFERTFQLNGKVLTEAIGAHYADGVLTVTLPKNPATNQPAQDIAVA